MRISDWEIKARSETCGITGKSFVDDEVFHTLLFQHKEGLERLDLSEEAYRARTDQDTPALSSWKSHFKAAPPGAQEAVGRKDAESELRRLLDKGEESTAKVCRLLALLLERKRILKRRETFQREERTCIVYEHAETQETFIVPDVEFKLSDLSQIQMEVMQNSESKVFSGDVDGVVAEGA
ncbi:MAG: hypothetical protein ACFCUX_07430 [Candidatus Methylacidiphilales bacterium]